MDTKINLMGNGTGILKPLPVHKVAVDRAIRTSKHIGSINTNPSKRDCVAWTGKDGKLIYREDYEKEQFDKHLLEAEEPMSFKNFVKELWL